MVVRKKKPVARNQEPGAGAGAVAPAQIARLAHQRFPAARKLRRALHQCPELAFQEFETGTLIAAALKEIGCKVQTGVGRTGILGTLTGATATGLVVAVRSDMDALPLTEQTGLPFASRNPGCMHACGHDAHMAVVVTVADLLARLKGHWSGTVKFIFQPAEEKPPGGAVGMIADGVLKNPDVATIFGVHVDPWIPTGQIGLRDGAMMAKVDDFDLTITGKSGHGARPHLGCDAVFIASQVVTALQSIVSRTTDPLHPAVLSIGRIDGGVARNVVADAVRLEGTVRTLDAKEAARIEKRILTVARGTARSHGGDARISYQRGYPVLYNDPGVNALYRKAATEMLGGGAIVDLSEPSMGGEDFAHYLHHVPGAMMRLGTRNTKLGTVYSWHHAKFTIDEDALEVGARVITAAVLEALTAGPGAGSGKKTRATTKSGR